MASTTDHSNNAPSGVAGPRSETQCRYKGSVCSNVRTIKDDGELHRFCEMHRAIAIRNQQRWQQRRRAKRQQVLHVYRPPLALEEDVKLLELDLSVDPLEPISDDEWLMLASLLVDAPAVQRPPSSTSTSTDTETSTSPSSRKTQRHRRRTQQAARVMLPYFHM